MINIGGCSAFPYFKCVTSISTTQFLLSPELPGGAHEILVCIKQKCCGLAFQTE